MMQQSTHNRSDSTMSEFQKSMLNKLDSLCSPSPTFDSVDAENSSLSNLSNKSSNLRRRRLYHSPGAIGVLQSPDPAAVAQATREARRKSFGNILAERARLVQKTLTRNALASQQSSTPVRPAPLSRLTGVNAVERLRGNSGTSLHETEPQLTASGVEDAANEVTAASENLILSDISRFEASGARLGLPTEDATTANRSQSSRGPQSMISDSMDSSQRSMSLRATKRRSKMSASVVEDSLKLIAFSTKRKRYDRHVQWFVLTCSSIKRLVEYVPLPSENLSRCTCLQLALRATKPVTSNDTDWLPAFTENIADLAQAAGKCALHKRCVKSGLTDKRPSERNLQSVTIDDNLKNLVAWLQDSRASLMERLARNIQLLL